MVSLPSGLVREDVELVLIETNQFTLFMKGKPYHQRFEGLSQYKKKLQNETMEFKVDGESIQSVKVFDVDRQILSADSTFRPIFFENGNYQIIVTSKVDSEIEFYHEHHLLRDAVSSVPVGPKQVLMGSLQFQNEVGLSSFEIRMQGKTLLTVTFEIFPSKLDYKEDYRKLLDEVNEEIYNLAFHFLRKTYLGARTRAEGEASAAEFYRLIQHHFRSFLQAIKRIEQQPHHQLITTHQKVRGDQLKKLDSFGRNQLRKKASLFQEVPNGIKFRDKELMPIEGWQVKKEHSFDTMENRLIKWLMIRIEDKLKNLLQKVETPIGRYKTEPDQEVVKSINDMQKLLQQRIKNPFWKTISKLDRSVMSLVIQMASGYREAFQIYVLLSRGLELHGQIYKMSVKDVAQLYEYWTYLKLGALLDKKYVLLSQDVVKVNREGLFVNLDGSNSAKRVYQHPHTGEKIILQYQKEEKHLPTITQKPDTMLSIEKNGKDYSYNYIFDAKYRIDFAVEDSYYGKRYKTPGPMEDDINTMHRYRDALVVQHKGPYERTAFGAYVLFPWFEEELYEQHAFYKSIDSVNIGGLPFLPNATRLVEQFVERLIEKSPEEIQEEGILPRGTLDRWQSSVDETVLVGLVSDEEILTDCIHYKTFKIALKDLKKGWQEAKYIALYLSSKVSSNNGVEYFGRIDDIRFSMISSNEQVVTFTVIAWESLKKVIRPVGYGISSYMLTTLNTLKEAEELPELYMKSKDELAVWRTMRRLTRKPRIDLNHTSLDHASEIVQIQSGEVSVSVGKYEIQVKRIGSMQLESLDRAEFLINPNRLFKKVIDILNR
ncbi:restriction endonuclease-like protein [Fictibacillus sp. b24]|uniref:restriction endonuclease-like protein n=1 Tax=Fictibacillus sp. b24 TaxID=3055863 RepID=UPI0025A11181|nr:restriction endonuclease-like protein [Fictibacillus sp. b24]MDM5317194.1 restriction endonuclease-like protein [Fictibacillus sp. b24]